MKHRNPNKGVSKEPHRNVLSTQEYGPAQQRMKIKKMNHIKEKRNVGEPKRRAS